MSCPEFVFGSSGGLGVERQSNNEIWREAPSVACFIPPTDSTRRILWHPSLMVCILGVHVFQTYKTYKIIFRSHRLAFRLIEVTSDSATSPCTSHEGQSQCIGRTIALNTSLTMIDVGPYRWQNIPTIFRTQSSRASRLLCLVCAQPYHAVPNSCHRCTLGQPLRMVLGHSVTVTDCGTDICKCRFRPFCRLHNSRNTN